MKQTDTVLPPGPTTITRGFSLDVYRFAAMFFFVFMGAGAQQAYLVRYLQRVTGWSGVASGSIIAAVYVSMLVFRTANLYLFPGWSDRFFTIVGSLTYLGFCLSMALLSRFPSYALALASAVGWGFGAALMWTGTTMQILALSDRAGGRHGTGMGILYASTHAGWLSGAVVLGLVYQSLPTDRLFLLYLLAAGITLVGNVISLSLPSSGPAVREPPTLRGLLEIMAHGRARISCLLQFLSALAYGLILGTFGRFVELEYGASWVWVPVSLYPAVRMVLSLAGGALSDRVGHAPVLCSGFLAGCVGLLACAGWKSPYALVLTGVALGLLNSTVPVVASAIVGDGADRKRRPLAYGIFFAWRDLGVVTSALGSNLLGQRVPMRSVFLLFAAVYGACAVFAALLPRFSQDKL